MERRKKIGLIAAALAIGGAGTGIAVAGAGSGEDTAVPISGSDLDRASAAALESTGGGQVTETETGDEESYYEVEVALPDGTQTDVQLDRGFNVVGSESDGTEDEETGADDD